MNISFTKGNWEHFFDYAYTWRFPEKPKFLQEENCIVNVKGDTFDHYGGYGFTSILLKEPYGPGTKVTFTASFENSGAPLLVIAEALDRDDQGVLRFGNYQEVVLWKNGVNVWDFLMENGEIKIEWLLRNEFPLEPGTPHTITVELETQRLKIRLREHFFELQVPRLPEKAYIGITACEGLNRFYQLEIESPQM